MSYEIKNKGVMPDGTKVQLEDWSTCYPNVFKPFDMIAAYPIAIEDGNGYFSPRKGEIFRCEFRFDSETISTLVINALIEGKITLNDIKVNYNGPFNNMHCLYKED